MYCYCYCCCYCCTPRPPIPQHPLLPLSGIHSRLSPSSLFSLVSAVFVSCLFSLLRLRLPGPSIPGRVSGAGEATAIRSASWCQCYTECYTECLVPHLYHRYTTLVPPVGATLPADRRPVSPPLRLPDSYKSITLFKSLANAQKLKEPKQCLSKVTTLSAGCCRKAPRRRRSPSSPDQ